MPTTMTNHMDNLTAEEQKQLRDWLTAVQAKARKTGVEMSKALGMSLGAWGGWVRETNTRAPSRFLLDWVSERFDYPLPPEVRQLGAARSHPSETTLKAQRRFRNKVSYGSATVSLTEPLEDEDDDGADDGSRSSLGPLPNDRSRVELAEQILSLVIELSNDLDLPEVEAWLRDNAGKLASEDRMRLVQILVR
jgi:hypothetical protein